MAAEDQLARRETRWVNKAFSSIFCKIRRFFTPLLCTNKLSLFLVNSQGIPGYTGPKGDEGGRGEDVSLSAILGERKLPRNTVWGCWASNLPGIHRSPHRSDL